MKNWYKIRNEVDMKQWLSSRANDDLMRRYYLPHIKERSMKLLNLMKNIVDWTCVGTEEARRNFNVQDTSNDNLESIENHRNLSTMKQYYLFKQCNYFSN